MWKAHSSIGAWLIAILFMCSVGWADTTRDWLTNRYDVLRVESCDKVVVDYKGLEIMVQLAFVADAGNEKAKAYLEGLLHQAKVVIVPEEHLSFSKDGLVQVYMFLPKDKDRLFINEELLREGLVAFVPGETERFKPFVDKLEVYKNLSIAKHRQSGEKQYVSELNSRRYHEHTCTWAEKILPQVRIVYDSFEAAEKADKQPAVCCMQGRIQELNAEKNLAPVHYKGSLFGIAGTPYFYSPTSLKLQKADKSKVKEYKTVQDAEKAKLKADPESLVIGNKSMDQPEKGFCIGRALPFFRPCVRKASDKSGLCEACLNGREK